MKISKNLPQYKNKTALLVVCGRQDARFLIAHAGVINEIKKIKVDKPKYSDRKGLFSTRSRGLTVRSGVVYKNTAHIAEREFLIDLGNYLKELEKNQPLDIIYLFCPSTTKRTVIKHMPSDLKEKIILVKIGNYNPAHPFDLLTKIKEHDEKTVVPKNLKPEAEKILEKAESAKEFLRERLH